MKKLGAGRFTTTDADIVVDADGRPLAVGRRFTRSSSTVWCSTGRHADRLGITAAIEAGEYPGVEVFDPVQHEGRQPMTTTRHHDRHRHSTTGERQSSPAGRGDETTTVDTRHRDVRSQPRRTAPKSTRTRTRTTPRTATDPAVRQRSIGAGCGKPRLNGDRLCRTRRIACSGPRSNDWRRPPSLQPAALWASGVELAGLLNDDGTVDAAKVSAAIGGGARAVGHPEPAAAGQLRQERGSQPRTSAQAVRAGRDDRRGHGRDGSDG